MNSNELIGEVDVLFITLDTLRYDVAQQLWKEGRTPHLAAHLPENGWEKRHTPGSFTFAAHAAFFAGFLPTPTAPGPHPRPFAMGFPGSETTTPETAVFDAPNLVAGLQQRGYWTICIGGVGFFNKQTPLGNVFPSYFNESHWSPELGVTEPRSTELQVALAIQRIRSVSTPQRVFLFMNVSALHQPNCCYLPGATEDSIQPHAAALEYVDQQLAPLFAELRQCRTWYCLICSDHGTAYGEDGYTGHRVAHPVVWEVPYAAFLLREESA